MSTVKPQVTLPGTPFNYNIPYFDDKNRVFQFNNDNKCVASVKLLILDAAGINLDKIDDSMHFGVMLRLFDESGVLIKEIKPKNKTIDHAYDQGKRIVVTVSWENVELNEPKAREASLQITLDGSDVTSTKKYIATVPHYYPENGDYTYNTDPFDIPFVVPVSEPGDFAALSNSATYKVAPEDASPLLHGAKVSYGENTSVCGLDFAQAVAKNTFFMRNMGTREITLRSVRVGLADAGAIDDVKLLPGELASVGLGSLLKSKGASGISVVLRAFKNDEEPHSLERATTPIVVYDKPLELLEANTLPACRLDITQQIGDSELVFVVDMSGSMNPTSRIDSVRAIWSALVTRFKEAHDEDVVSFTQVRLVLIWQGKVWCRYPLVSINDPQQAGGKSDYVEQFTQNHDNTAAGTKFSKRLRNIFEGMSTNADEGDQIRELVGLIYGDSENTTSAPLTRNCMGTSPIGDGILRALGSLDGLGDTTTCLFDDGEAMHHNVRLLVLISDGGENAGTWKFLGQNYGDNITKLREWLDDQGVKMIPISYVPFQGMWDKLLEAGNTGTIESDYIPVDVNDHPLDEFWHIEHPL